MQKEIYKRDIHMQKKTYERDLGMKITGRPVKEPYSRHTYEKMDL